MAGRYYAKSWSWSKTNNNKGQRPPPGLRGKAIGMFYKNQGMSARNRKEDKKELEISLQIPQAIELQMCMNLKSIAKIAKSLNISKSPAKILNTSLKKETSTLDNKNGIELCPIKDEVKSSSVPVKDEVESASDIVKDEVELSSVLIKDEIKTEDKDEMKSCETSDEIMLIETSDDSIIVIDDPIIVIDDNDELIGKKSMDVMENKPGTSAALDFIPFVTDDKTTNEKPEFINVSKMNDYGSGNRLLSLSGGGDYKYSYDDIITGTFDEKLDECLSKGVIINLLNDNIEELNKNLHKEYQAMVTKTGYKRMLNFRETLPTYKKTKDLLDVITNNQVIVISGETGCGKSTQVPQIILDDAICNNKGANIKILVTQPRRIAASSLASRVAEERAETLGNSVGYAVRLEKRDARPRGSIMFCTTGILLADLEVNQGLTSYSHVILDEVHERDCHIDLSMCMLKKVLKKRKDLKLILMSATIDAEKLSEYFDNCPMMHIEGLAYPVQDIYLEDILQMTKYRLPPIQQKRQEPRWMQHTRRHKGRVSNDMEKEIQYRAEIGPWLETVKHNLDREVYQTLQDCRIEELQYDLICEVLIYISRGPPGAVLVFLPGIGEITKVMKLMADSRMFPRSHFEIYPLHSKLPTLDQHKIFTRPRHDVRKIIIATNIAETSITIDDIVYVVDCGRIKINGLHVEENISTLKVEWIAQANLRQRRGRAGRCQPGVCYHLVTSHRASLLAERLLPELQRSDLLEPVLTIKRLRLGRAADALQEVPSPPAHSTVQWAVKHLQQCGALDEQETLTPLGWHLARLPVHPAAGKLLLLGALFGCLDRAASVAAVWGFKDPFQIVIGKETEVDNAKRRFALGEPSDHVAISEAIIQWERQRNHERRQFAYENFLANNTLQLLSEMKKQFGNSLRSMGFLPSGDIESEWENRNADNLSLFKAVVAASLYPKIATVRWQGLNKRNKQMRIKVQTPDDQSNSSVHPSSVMSAPSFKKHKGPAVPLCDRPGANWLVYWLKQRSSDLFLIELTLVYTLPLLFFGELNVTVKPIQNEEECYMSISTIKVRCKRKTANLLIELRSLLDQVLASKVMLSSNQSTKRSRFEESVLNAVADMITAEDEQADYLGDDDTLDYECDEDYGY